MIFLFYFNIKKTNASGIVSFIAVEAIIQEIRASKEGYKSASVPVEVVRRVPFEIGNVYESIAQSLEKLPLPTIILALVILAIMLFGLSWERGRREKGVEEKEIWGKLHKPNEFEEEQGEKETEEEQEEEYKF